MPGTWTTISPLIAGLKDYKREQLVGDLIAGVIVAIMLIPQGMAYAMLAGLPPQVGLYASIVPVLIYSVFGSSNYLAVGPVAMVSLLVVSGVSELAPPGSPEFISLCLTLALMVGVIQVTMSFLNLGFLTNFISHPVLIGFTSAAAIVIGFSQLKHLFGFSISNSEYPIELIIQTFANLGQTNLTTLLIGIVCCLTLLFFSYGLAPVLTYLGVNKPIASTISKTGPLVAVLLAAIAVWYGQLSAVSNVKIVGEIPSGLPGFTLPNLNLAQFRALLPLAVVITLVGYLESISVAKTLASRKRQKVDANRELFALGMADIGAAFTGGYPVTGGFSRSVVNFSAGAATPMGSVFTALLIALSVVFFTPTFYYIPTAVLAAIIVVAVATLIDLKTPIQLWRYSRPDAIALGVTFFSVILLGIETGIFIGIGSTIVMLLWRTSRPHIAVVGRIRGTEHFRNVLRHETETLRGVLAIRIDESLFFANSPQLESFIFENLAEQQDVHTVLLISSGINDIDATGIDVLDSLRVELGALGVRLLLSDVKGPVLDRLKLAAVDTEFLTNQIFLSANDAFDALTNESPEQISIYDQLSNAPDEQIQEVGQ